MNHDDSLHEHEVLASGEVCRVERCPDCDVVHLHLGAVSLRLTSAAFESACATLFDAQRNKRQYLRLSEWRI